MSGSLPLMLTDAVTAAIAIVTANWCVDWVYPAAATFTSETKILWAAAMVIVTNGCMALYDTATIAPIDRFRRRVLGALLLPLLAFVALAVLDRPSIADILALSLAALLVVPLGIISEAGLRKALPSAWNAATILVGSPAAALRLGRHFAGRPEFGLRPVGFVSDTPNTVSTELPWLGRIANLDTVAAAADVVVVVVSDDTPPISPTQLPVRRVVVVPETTSVPALWLAARHFGTTAGIEFLNPLQWRLSRAVKRALELCIAVPAALCALPLIVVLALLVKAVSRGPAFYTQKRVGWKGAVIAVPKLRSMHVDAEARLQEILARDPDARREWDLHMKLRNDPRILPVIGPFIRMTSFDELPQLWAVIRGDLSLVGPRPFPTYHTERFPTEFQELRASVKPGLTGLWQVSDRSDADLREQEIIDTFYIRNWSLWLDAYIVIRTVPAMFSGHGAR